MAVSFFIFSFNNKVNLKEKKLYWKKRGLITHDNLYKLVLVLIIPFVVLSNISSSPEFKIILLPLSIISLISFISLIRGRP